MLDTLPARPGAGRLPGRPTSSSTSSSASSRRRCPTARRTRPTTTSRSTARPTAASTQRERFIRARLPGRRRDDAPGAGAAARPRPDDVRLVRPRLRAAVRGDRRQQGARRPRPAVAAADVELPPGDGRDDRQGQGLLGRRHGADLPQPRRPRPGGRRRSQQVAAADEAATVAQIKAAFLALDDPNDWTGDGDPEGWDVIDRAFTKAEARYIPNGARQHGRHGAPDPHGRPRRVLRAAVPVRRGHAGHADRPLGVLRPARLRARRAGPRQRTRTCARRSSPAARRSRAASRADVRSIDLAPTAAFLLDVPVPQHSQGVVRRDLLDARQPLHAAVDHRAERLPRPARADHHADRRAQRRASAGRRSWRRCSTRRPRPARARRCCWPPATTSAPRRRTRRCSRTCRRSTSRTRGGSTPRASATTSSTSASSGSSQHQERADFPFLSANIVEEATGEAPRLARTARRSSDVNGVRVGVIGATVRTTPELVRADATAGLDVPRRGGAHPRASRERLRRRASGCRSS